MSKEERLKVLIVDDEKTNINDLSSILWSEYDVLAAKDGETALAVAQTSKPDIILLDVIMPGMSGFDVIVRLKNSDLTRDIPVIFITGLDSNQDEEKGLSLYIGIWYGNKYIINFKHISMEPSSSLLFS